jgi:hypothetical protein
VSGGTVQHRADGALFLAEQLASALSCFGVQPLQLCVGLGLRAPKCLLPVGGGLRRRVLLTVVIRSHADEDRGATGRTRLTDTRPRLSRVSLLESYFRALAQVRKQPEATPELSLREPLLSLLRQLATELGRPRLLIAPEAAAEEAGQPDVFIKAGPRLVGFVETKAPGTDIGRWLKTSPQARRYRASLGNWAVTDYYRFIFVREGDETAHLEIGDPEGRLELLPPAREEELRDAFGSFLAYAPPVLRSPQRLALELARRARLLRDGLEGILEQEAETPLAETFAFYRRTLMSDLDEAGFADTFAQTIAYGPCSGGTTTSRSRSRPDPFPTAPMSSPVASPSPRPRSPGGPSERPTSRRCSSTKRRPIAGARISRRGFSTTFRPSGSKPMPRASSTTSTRSRTRASIAGGMRMPFATSSPGSRSAVIPISSRRPEPSGPSSPPSTCSSIRICRSRLRPSTEMIGRRSRRPATTSHLALSSWPLRWSRET